MAINLGKIYSQDLSENDYKILGIGINRRSDSAGIFAVNYTTITQAKDNLINLIMTKRGERVMQPEFGCDVHRIIFEPMVEDVTKERVIDYIESAVAAWLPYLKVDRIDVDMDNSNIDKNTIEISIAFSLKINSKMFESVQITINQ